MNAHLYSRRRHGGFSLVELMVSVVIGLLALLFATRLIISGEQNKDAAVGGSDSMQNGMIALFSLNTDAAESGWGLNDPMVAGCDTVFADANGYQLPQVARGGANVSPLAAVVIQSNGANPDVISFNSGTSQAGAGSVKLFANYTGGSTISTDSSNPYGFADGDVLVVAPVTPDRPCTLLQTAGFDLSAGGTPNNMLLSTGGKYRFNPAASMATNYAVNVTYIYNLGPAPQLHLHTWSVNKGILLLRATDLAGAEAQGASVVDNIVSIKAQYGLDTRALPNYNPDPSGDGVQISQWSTAMTDADGDGVIGSAGDYQRVTAVRLAVVARSKSPEKPNAAGVCSATTVLPTVFGSASPANVAPVPMQVNVAITGDPVDWKCYRYRVFETIVPIRNAQWRPS